MLIVMSCLNSCAAENFEQNILPEFPLAGAKVAKELENLSVEEYPFFWEWLARLNKLKQELEN